jgi:hypothetical protein
VACRAGLKKSVACVGIPTTFPGTSDFCARFFVISEIFGHVLVSGYIILKCVLKVWAGFHLTGVLLRSANEPAGNFLTTLPAVRFGSSTVGGISVLSCLVLCSSVTKLDYDHDLPSRNDPNRLCGPPCYLSAGYRRLFLFDKAT